MSTVLGPCSIDLLGDGLVLRTVSLMKGAPGQGVWVPMKTNLSQWTRNCESTSPLMLMVPSEEVMRKTCIPGDCYPLWCSFTTDIPYRVWPPRTLSAPPTAARPLEPLHLLHHAPLHVGGGPLACSLNILSCPLPSFILGFLSLWNTAMQCDTSISSLHS